MRHLLQLIFLLAFSVSLWAQAPQQFKFQAVARDAGGSPYASANLAVRVSMVRDGVSGLVDYSERHTVTTSPLGVFDLAIGDGVALSGMMTDVDWANHPYYLKIDIDPAGGTSYLNLGTSQLLSVPYAIYAGESGNGGGGNPTDELQSLIYDPVTQVLTLTDGNSVTLNTAGGTDSQTLTFNAISGDLSISNGNTINIPAGAPGPQGPQGEAGPAGPQGNPGAAGPQGPQGSAGTGINLLGTVATVGDLPAGGSQGDLYIVTASGDGYAWDGSMWNNVGPIQGPQGESGPAGMAGPVGATGPAGPQGEQGPQGLSGPVGSQGPVGPQGATGPQGPAGQDGTGISIQGTVATVDDLPGGGNTQGDLYIVSADGNGYVWDGTMWTNVGQIQGPQGPQGAPGSQGIPGDTGPAGPIGATGPQGLQGDAGPAGPQGLQGDVGPAGATGPAGPQGDQGLPGPQGLQGDAGPAGPQGDQGLPGPQGLQGDIGPAGPQGDQGLVGPQGLQGDVGPVGPQGPAGEIELPYYDETETPGAAFHIHNDANASYGIAGSNSPGGEALPANRAGVLGHSLNGHGVYGYAENSFYAGVQGVSNSSTGSGVLGYGFGGGVGGHFYTTSNGQAALTTGVGNVGIGIDEPEMKMHVGGDLLVQTNLGSLHLGFPDNGNQWKMSTIGSGANLQYGFKPDGSSNFTTHFRMRESGEFQVGDISGADAWVQVRKNSGVEKTHLLLQETQDEFARLGFGNTVHEDAEWHIAATSRNGASGAADSKMNFYFRNDQGAADRMTILGSGRVGINNTNPDEELVVGSNLNSGWVIPAVTVGNSSGGAIEVGTSAISFSAGAGTTFGRTRLIATDANGFGQGKIEMRTRQLNVGVSPGVNDTRGYALRVEQNTGATGGAYGILLLNGENDVENWEFYVGTTTANGGSMALYHNNAYRGVFDQTSGNYSSTSDARLKTNVSTLSGVLPRLLELQPKYYNYKTNLERKYHGFLAQDLQAVFPELVTTTSPKAGEEATLLVDYSQLAVLSIAAIQEQQQVIDQQKEQLIQQAKHLEAMEARLQKLEALLEK